MAERTRSLEERTSKAKAWVQLLERGAYERSVAEAARDAGSKFGACVEVVPRMKLAERE